MPKKRIASSLRIGPLAMAAASFACTTIAIGKGPTTDETGGPPDSCLTQEPVESGDSLLGRIPLPPDARQQIQSTRMVVTFDPSALEGLPLAAILDTYPVTEDLVIQLSAQLAPILWLAIQGIEPHKAGTTTTGTLLQETEASHLLHIDVKLAYSDDFSELRLKSVNSLHSTADKALGSPLYSNTVTFLEARAGDPSQSPHAVWMDDLANDFFGVLQKGLVEIARMTVYDLHTGEEAANARIDSRRMNGFILLEGETRIWVRDTSGRLHSIQKPE